MADYPDWTRLFHLVGTEITIPISIDAVTADLEVTVTAVDATVNVNIAHSDVVMYVDLRYSYTTLDVNIESQDANITFEFADQSVAVFDAAKWFAHEADQVFVTGYDDIAVGAASAVCTRVVPTGKVFYLAGCGYAVYGMGALPYGSYLLIQVAATVIGRWGSITGTAVIFDVPIRATAGQTVWCTLSNGGPNEATFCGEFWGWDEDA